MKFENNENEKFSTTNSISNSSFASSSIYFIPSGSISNGTMMTVGEINKIMNAIAGKTDYEFLPKTIDPETKTHVYGFENRLKVALYTDGKIKRYVELNLPTVKDVQVINDTVVVVCFDDGTSEKAVLSADDTFNLEQGISICITKKILSNQTEGNGTAVYNKLVKYCMDVYANNKKKEQEAANKKRIDAARRKKFADKKRNKHERKIQREREAQIEIQKEAYLRAMKELNDKS